MLYVKKEHCGRCRIEAQELINWYEPGVYQRKCAAGHRLTITRKDIFSIRRATMKRNGEAHEI